MVENDTPPEAVEIRKYANRRYYDVSRSTHVTLEQIRDMICEGRDVRVTDFKTGQDITPKVLAQIMLEHDPLKLDTFPAPLLHLLIRTNERIVIDFVDKYFNQALASFLESQKQFDHYLRQSLGLQDQAPAMPWGRGWFGGLMPPVFGPSTTPSRPSPTAQSAQTAETQPGPGSENQALREVVDRLKSEVSDLKKELDSRKRRRTKQ